MRSQPPPTMNEEKKAVKSMEVKRANFIGSILEELERLYLERAKIDVKIHMIILRQNLYYKSLMKP